MDPAVDCDGMRQAHRRVALWHQKGISAKPIRHHIRLEQVGGHLGVQNGTVSDTRTDERAGVVGEFMARVWLLTPEADQTSGRR